MQIDLEKNGQSCCGNGQVAGEHVEVAIAGNGAGGCCSQSAAPTGAAAGCCDSNGNGSRADSRALVKSVLAIPPHQRQRDRPRGSNALPSASDVVRETSGPSAASRCAGGAKDVVLFSVDLCGFRVPVLLLVGVFVGLWFLSPTAAIVFGVLALVAAALSRIRGANGTGNPSAGGYQRVATGGPRVKTVRDLPPMPRKGGG